MLHVIVITLLILFILACLVALFRISPEDAPKTNHPDPHERADTHTHFYKTVKPNGGLPPVPQAKRPRHAEPVTDVMRALPKQQGAPATTFLPRVYKP